MTGRALRALCLVVCAAVLAPGGFSVARAAEAFTLTSTTFKDGGLMPKKTGNNTAGNANCIGANLSPQMAWSGAPEGTRSFALTMVDPEGRRGLGAIIGSPMAFPPT